MGWIRYKKRRLSPAITTHILNMPDSCDVRGSLANSQSTYIYYLLNVFLSLALLSGVKGLILCLFNFLTRKLDFIQQA